MCINYAFYSFCDAVYGGRNLGEYGSKSVSFFVEFYFSVNLAWLAVLFNLKDPIQALVTAIILIIFFESVVGSFRKLLVFFCL